MQKRRRKIVSNKYIERQKQEPLSQTCFVYTGQMTELHSTGTQIREIKLPQ
jgi:hypothetical protein